jgi:adenine deaminase
VISPPSVGSIEKLTGRQIAFAGAADDMFDYVDRFNCADAERVELGSEQFLCPGFVDTHMYVLRSAGGE